DLASDVVPKFRLKDPNCNIELVAHYYDNTSSLDYDDEIYSLMSNTDKAALKIHEAVYKLRRYFDKDTTSEKTREIVANIMAGKQLGDLYDIRTLDYDLVDSGRTSGSLGLFDMTGLDLLLGGKTVSCVDPASKKLALEASIQNARDIEDGQ